MYFRALREGARPPASWQKMIDGMSKHESRAYGIDPASARMLTKGVFLLAGRHYVCLDVASRPSRSSSGAPRLGPSLAGTCAPIKKAIRNGISVGTPSNFLIAVPDGTTAVEYRPRWHGAWRRIATPDGFARLPGLGAQVRLVS